MEKVPENNVDEYISSSPREVQGKLHDIRSTIQKIAPTATERTDYFEIPGYSYDDGDDYDGMFVWFSYKKPFIRLHVRPPVLEDFKKEVMNYTTTKAVLSFPENTKLPIALIKKLTKASISVMKAKKLNKK